MGQRRRWVATLMGVTLAAACSGGGSAETGTVLRTQGDIAVDDSAVTTSPPTNEDGESEEQTTGDTTTTLPQEELTAGEEFFLAVEEFSSCLDADGFTFMGVPDATLGPDDPLNQPAYLEALGACAARSQILEKIQAADAERAELSPAEIEESNRTYLIFRECMVGRGWQIPEPTPDETGLLFAGYQAAASWQAPPGEAIADSDDVEECADQADVDLGSNS